MSQIPSFAAIAFEPVDGAAAAGGTQQPWLTPESIQVKPVYGPDDVKGLDFLDTWPGVAPI